MKHRDQVRQVIKFTDKEGLPQEKVIFHQKKFNAPQYKDYGEVWNSANKTKRVKHDKGDAEKVQGDEPGKAIQG